MNNKFLPAFAAAMLFVLAALMAPPIQNSYAACTPGESRSCGSNLGICTFGTVVCQENGTWGACTGGIMPETETCNRIDDNCNGLVDEGKTCLSTLVPPCKENWKCSEWLPCSTSEGTIRVCEDLNICNTSQNKPAAEKPCFQESFLDRLQNTTSQAAKNVGVSVKEQNVLSYATLAFIFVFMFLAWLLSVDRKRKNAVVSNVENKTSDQEKNQPETGV